MNNKPYDADSNMYQVPYDTNNTVYQEPYEESESQSNVEGEHFEDEPEQQYGHDPYYEQQPHSEPYEGQYDDPRFGIETIGEPYQDHDPSAQQPYAQPREGMYDDPQYDNNHIEEPFQDHDPYAQQQHHQPYPDDGIHQGDNYVEREARPEQAPPMTEPVEPRKHKYSTANMHQTGKWTKWCKIFAMFLLFIAFMIGISILFNHFFFGDQSDNGPQVTQRPQNATFPKDKHEVDEACSRESMVMDEGALCQEACAPQFFKCCDPFDELQLYNYTEVADTSGNSTGNLTDAELARTEITDEKNTTFLDGYDNFDDTTCSFDTELRGCMSYAKCQALGGQADPAPATLPDLCSLDRLKKDAGSCQELCRKLDCCYSLGSDNCMADKFDLCMDYAPCQNLRSLDDPAGVLPTAPRTLDYDCYWQQPECAETCAAAKCCNDATSSCFQSNFMACLTYSPCNNVTDVSVTLTPQFSVVKKPPNEIVFACNAHKEAVLKPTTKSCEDYCGEAACCWDGDPKKNCFQKDPLGCLAWDAQCQVLLDM
jgi:hypothetical protein